MQPHPRWQEAQGLGRIAHGGWRARQRGGIGALASFLLMDRAGAAAFFGIYMKAAVVADSSRHVSRIGLVSPCTVIVSSHCGLYQLQCSVCAQSHKTRGPRKFHQNIKLRVL